MSRHLGIDLGTTTIAAVVLDTDSAQVIARHSTPNDSRLSSDEKSPGRSEWDIDLYILGMVAMGFWFARRHRTSDDYFVAGRRMGWIPIALSMLFT